MELLRSARRALEESPASNNRLLAIVLNNWSYIHFKRNELEESLALNEEVISLQDRTGLGNTFGRLDMEMNQAALLEAVGELSPGIEIRKDVLERMRERKVPEAHLAHSMTNYAGTLVMVSRLDEALPILMEARAHASEAENSLVVALADLMIGRAHVLMGRFDEGEARLRAAEAVFSRNPAGMQAQLTAIELVRIVALMSRGRLDEARTRIESVLVNEGYPDEPPSRLLRAALHVATRVALAEHDYRRAEAMSSDMLSLAESVARNPSASAHVGEALWFRAQARMGLSDDGGALHDLERAIPPLENGFGRGNPSTLQAHQLLASLSRRP